jgi:hypothetical protein
VRVTFTRLTGPRYGVDVVRESGPPARLRVTPSCAERLPQDIACFLVEREFGLKLGVFGQLAAGGDAGTFWAAPADRTARLAQQAHRLQVSGHGDLGRSARLAAVCTAAWEFEIGRRWAPLDGPARHLIGGPPAWWQLEMAGAAARQLACAVGAFHEAAAVWSALGVRESIGFDWPPSLMLARLRSA